MACMVSTDAISEAGEETSSLPVPDELLAEIFLRLPTAADLVRASAVCVSFHHLTAARSFIRRFRKLHVPPLLGFLEDQTFHPAAPPHPIAPAASAVAIAADFSFSFLPNPARAGTWAIQDSRDGRILLETEETAVFREMVVCDPLHRRYLLLPHIPDNLAASMEDPLPLEQQYWRHVFLVPTGEEEEEEETAFKVAWMGQCKSKLFAFVFSSSTGRWRAIPPRSWKDFFPRVTSSIDTLFLFRQYAHGCFYWTLDCETEHDMLVLDTRRLEFSIAEPPPEAKDYKGLPMVMVDAGEGRLGMFVLTGSAYDLSYSIRQNGEWHLEKTIPLGPGHYLIGSTQRYLLLCWLRSLSCRLRSSLHKQSCFYTLDIETFQLETTCHTSLYGFLELHAYSNFPPSFLALPTVSTGVEEEATRTLVQGCIAS